MISCFTELDIATLWEIATLRENWETASLVHSPIIYFYFLHVHKCHICLDLLMFSVHVYSLFFFFFFFFPSRVPCCLSAFYSGSVFVSFDFLICNRHHDQTQTVSTL